MLSINCVAESGGALPDQARSEYSPGHYRCSFSHSLRIRGRRGAEGILCGRRGQPNKASRNFELAVFGAQSFNLLKNIRLQPKPASRRSCRRRTRRAPCQQSGARLWPTASKLRRCKVQGIAKLSHLISQNWLRVVRKAVLPLFGESLSTTLTISSVALAVASELTQMAPLPSCLSEELYSIQLRIR